jgi:hypothetical protein
VHADCKTQVMTCACRFQNTGYDTCMQIAKHKFKVTFIVNIEDSLNH